MSNNYDPNDPNNPNQGYPPTGTPQNYSAPNPGYQPPPAGYPPQGGYQQPPQGNQPPPGYQPNSGQPDFSKMQAEAMGQASKLPQKWGQAINARTPDFFAREGVNASWNLVIVGLLIQGIVSGLAIGLGRFLALLRYDMGSAFGGIFSGFFNGLIGTFITFFIGVGLTYLFATIVWKAKGGDFLQLAYVVSLYWVPLGILSSIVSAVGLALWGLTGFTGIFLTLSGILAAAIFLAAAYFLYLAVQGVFRHTSQDAMYITLAVVVVPILGLLGGSFGLGFLSSLGGWMRYTYF